MQQGSTNKYLPKNFIFFQFQDPLLVWSSSDFTHCFPHRISLWFSGQWDSENIQKFLAGFCSRNREERACKTSYFTAKLVILEICADRNAGRAFENKLKHPFNTKPLPHNSLWTATSKEIMILQAAWMHTPLEGVTFGHAVRRWETRCILPMLDLKHSLT